MKKRPPAIILWPPPWQMKSLFGRVTGYAYAALLSPIIVLVSLLAFGANAFFKQAPRNVTVAEVAAILERFVNNTGTEWEWDDFINGGSLADAPIERIRQECSKISAVYPPSATQGYCSEQGLQNLRLLIEQLRESKQ